MPAFLCDFLYITGCEMLGDWGKEWIELEVFFFPQLFAEHLNLINRDCKMPSGEECNRIKVVSVFGVTNGNTKNKHRRSLRSAHLCSLSVSATWLVRFSLTSPICWGGNVRLQRE